MANPHGLTDDTMPALKAKPRGNRVLALSRKFPELADASSTLPTTSPMSEPVKMAPTTANPSAPTKAKSGPMTGQLVSRLLLAEIPCTGSTPKGYQSIFQYQQGEEAR